MIRKVFKKKGPSRFDSFLQKYNLPPELFGINRRAVTRALLVGLFIAFIPMPAQMVAVVVLAPMMRYNVFISLLMVWLTNPITMPFIYYIEYELGSLVLMQDTLPDLQISLTWFTDNIMRILLPLYVGALLVSTVVSVVVYVIANRLWVYSVKKEQQNRNGSLSSD